MGDGTGGGWKLSREEKDEEGGVCSEKKERSGRWQSGEGRAFRFVKVWEEKGKREVGKISVEAFEI